MKIRQAIPADALSVAMVQVESWQDTYKGIIPDQYLAQMTIENREPKWKEIIASQLVFVAENDTGQVIGFSNGGRERTGKYPGYQGEIYAIYILPSYQRKGIGKLLMKSLTDEFKKQNMTSMTVLVLEENPARFFYQSLGAEQIDTIQLNISARKLNEIVYGWQEINI